MTVFHRRALGSVVLAVFGAAGFAGAGAEEGKGVAGGTAPLARELDWTPGTPFPAGTAAFGAEGKTAAVDAADAPYRFDGRHLLMIPRKVLGAQTVRVRMRYPGAPTGGVISCHLPADGRRGFELGFAAKAFYTLDGTRLTGQVSAGTRASIVSMIDPKPLAFAPGRWYEFVAVFAPGEALTLVVADGDTGKVLARRVLPCPGVEALVAGAGLDRLYIGGRRRSREVAQYFAPAGTELGAVSVWGRALSRRELADGLGLDFSAFSAEGGEVVNHIPDSGFEWSRFPVYHRMRDRDYREPLAWTADETAAVDGRRSLRGEGGRTLRFSAEVIDRLPHAGRPWTFSIHLKADRPETPVTLKVSSYRFLDREDRTGVVEVGTDWARHTLTVKEFHAGRRRIGATQGPIDFAVEIPEGVTVWADAAQWEAGDRPGPYIAGRSGGATPRAEWAAAPSPPPPVPTPVAVAGVRRGSVRVTVRNDTPRATVATPLSLGVLSPEGWWGANTRFELVDAGGAAVPFQTAPLALHVKDRSRLSTRLDFAAPLAAGDNDFVLRYETLPGDSSSPPEAESSLDRKPNAGRLSFRPAENARQLWAGFTDADGRVVIGPGILRATDLAGRAYVGRVAETRVEVDGPVYAVVACSGALVPEDADAAAGEGLLAFTARLHRWRDVPGIEVELTVVNRHPERGVALRELFWRAPLPAAADGAGAAEVLQAFDPGQGAFALGTAGADRRFRFEDNRRGMAAVSVPARDGRVYRVALRDAWRKHPSSVAWRDGAAEVAFWPGEPVAPVLFAPGMAATRHGRILLAEAADGDDAELFDRPPVPTVDPAWSLAAGVPFRFAPPGRTPLVDRYLVSGPPGLHDDAVVEREKWYGLFDYGDHAGDGGWANLESYVDYSLMQRGLRNGSATALRRGYDAAAHYRDVDLDQRTGRAIMHSCNHVSGGNHFGHSWVQGVFLHYLLTGSPRSREAAHLAGEALLAMDPADPQVRDNRNLGYYLLVLADAYAILGDSRYRERYDRQIAEAVDILARPQAGADLLMQRTSRPREGSFFFWPASGLVPFASWYGCAGLLRMHGLTGDPALLEHAKREVANALDLELVYRVHLEELYPGLPAEETLPLMASDYVGGRGSYFYPVMADYARATGDESKRGLAVRIAYARVLEGKGIGADADILMAAAFDRLPPGFDEQKTADAVRALFLRGSAPTLPNGDFSQTRSYAEMMTAKRPDAVTPAWALDRPYPRHWRINAGKEYTATEFMRYRPELYELEPGTLRLRFDRRRWYAQHLTLDSARVALTPGTWTFRGGCAPTTRWATSATPCWYRISALRASGSRFRQRRAPRRAFGAPCRKACGSWGGSGRARRGRVCAGGGDGGHGPPGHGVCDGARHVVPGRGGGVVAVARFRFGKKTVTRSAVAAGPSTAKTNGVGPHGSNPVCSEAHAVRFSA